MKFRFFTDAHLAPQRAPSRPHRFSEQGATLVKECVSTCPPDIEHIIFGGDAIQMDRPRGQAYHESLMREFGRAVRENTNLPAHFIAGNHDYDYFKSFEDIATLSGMPCENKIIDTPDGHRLVFLNEEFHKRGEGRLLPYSEATLTYLEEALERAPTPSVTIFTHTPPNDSDWEVTKILMRDGDPEYCFRPNSKAFRDILEHSGKNCLVVSGHSHYEGFEQQGRTAYLTVQSLVEEARLSPGTVYARWADIERKGADDLLIRLHGYKGHDIHYTFKDWGKGLSASQPALLLAAE